MKQKTASPGAEPGSSALASNSLTTAPQCHTSFDELILLYHNYFSLPWTLFEAGGAVVIMNSNIFYISGKLA